MVDPKLGTKRGCEACEAKFYDLNKHPAVCPKCSHRFDPSLTPMGTVPMGAPPHAQTPAPAQAQAQVPAPVAESRPENDEDALEEDDDTLSLDAIVDEEADKEDGETLTAFGQDAALLDDDDSDNTLLETEEDEDDFLEDSEDKEA